MNSDQDQNITANYQLGGDMFGGGGQPFVFNLGGGPGFRVHQFGGGRPRRRPREAQREEDEQGQTLSSILMNLLPLLILVVLPLLSSLLSSGEAPSRPDVRLKKEPPFIEKRTTPVHKLPYYLNPDTVKDWSNRKLYALDQNVERDWIQGLRYECSVEQQKQNQLKQDAQGWFFQDTEKMREAYLFEKKSCNQLRKLGESLNGY